MPPIFDLSFYIGKEKSSFCFYETGLYFDLSSKEVSLTSFIF